MNPTIETTRPTLDISIQDLNGALPGLQKLALKLYAQRDLAPLDRLEFEHPLVNSHGEFPKKGIPLKDLITDDLFALLTDGLNSNSSGYMGEIPGGGLAVSAIADLLVSLANRWPGLSKWAPGLNKVERQVILWMCQMLNMPERSGGVLTSGGSMANLTAVHAARVAKLGEDSSNGVIYYSELSHNSNFRAARTTGFRSDQMREIRCDANGRLEIDDLEAKVSDDIKRGRRPFLVIGTAGTTYAGAVDPLNGISRLCHSHDMWFHVDAAWAGSFMLTERGQSLMHGIELADSITFDPHKGLWTPWGCGALLVRDLSALQGAFFADAGYLDMDGEEDLNLSPANISPELSRSSRGLQVWLPLMLNGVDEYRKVLNERLDLAELAAEEIAKIPGFVVVTGPSLGMINISFEPDGDQGLKTTATNKQMLEIFNSSGDLYISGNKIDGRFLLHISTLHHRTTEVEVRRATERLSQIAGRLR